MGFTFVQSALAGDSSGSSVASIGVSLTGVGAGNLITNFVKHEGSTTTITDSDGTTTLSTGTYRSNPGGDSHGQWQYLLSANSGNKTYTSTFGASRPYPSTIVFEHSHTDAAVLEAQNTANGTSTAPNSGNFTVAGAGVAFGGYVENSTNTTSSELINGAAADGAVRMFPAASNYSSAWWRVHSSGFTGAASATLGASVAWACLGIAFREDTGPQNKGAILKKIHRPRAFAPGLAR